MWYGHFDVVVVSGTGRTYGEEGKLPPICTSGKGDRRGCGDGESG